MTPFLGFGNAARSSMSCLGRGRRLMMAQPSSTSSWRMRKMGLATTTSANAEKSPTTTEERQQLATIRLYRILQRTCRSFVAKDPLDDKILLQTTLEASDWGRHSTFRTSGPTKVEELYRFFYVANDDVMYNIDEGTISDISRGSIDDWYYQIVGRLHGDGDDDESLPPMTSMTFWTSPQQLQEAIREAFRLDYMDVLDPPDLHKWAIRAIQMLQEQKIMWDHSSSTETHGVRVTATSRCIGTTSPTAALPPTVSASLLESKFRFAYRIRIENVSDEYVQLLGRYWHIQETPGKDDDDDEPRPPIVVDAPVTGAVGHLPVLGPGQVFEYMSGTDLATTRGVMQGHFYMAKVEEGAKSAKSGDYVASLKVIEKMEVPVAPFALEAGP